MSRKPSPMFTAALDAVVALRAAEDKLRNVRRRGLSKSERYAIDLALDAADDLQERYDRMVSR